MTISITPKFQSAITDDPSDEAAGRVTPTRWNDGSDITMATGKLIGRTSAGDGAAEEVPLAAGSDVAAGTNGAMVATPKNIADSGGWQTLTDGATVSWDMSLGYNAKVTLGGNRTLATPTNAITGRVYQLQVVQDATGSRTLTFPSSTYFDFGGAGTPTLSTTASKMDLLILTCLDASTPLFRVAFNAGV